uniref:Uncharacterized protein n=1 Tax=Avena sativa TaxID=4498 RepID=A0ACD5UFA3_AVESA
MSVDCIPIFFLLFLISFCKADDQLTHEKPLTHRDMLISKSGYFALGFFSLTSSNKSFYLGVWYHGLPGPRTVVWVANRDNPITTPSSAVLTVTTSSDLVLAASDGHNIWKTASSITAGAVRAHAVLLDSGNFVLRLPNATNIWQSFDHPTDTILPTMKFLYSYKAEVVGRLVAWKSSDDPSSGDFSYSSDPSSPDLQAAIWNKISPYCRMGVWNGVPVSGETLLTNASTILYYQTTINSGDEVYSMFTIFNNLPFTRVILDYTGDLKVLSWNSHSSSWVLFGERPAAACDLYNSCGPFSYCDVTQIVPMCECLDGFEPNDDNFGRGCRRIAVLKCDKQSHFVALPEMKVPDNFLHIRNKSFEQCKAMCNHNCSCTAFAYANLSSAGAMADPSRCLVWSGELIDVAKATAGENLYVRLADTAGIWFFMLSYFLQVIRVFYQ